MKIEEFKATLKESNPPQNIKPEMLALWWDAKGNWAQAHKVAQDIQNSYGSWIHAYLHRKEGDEGNAGYWYERASKPHCQLSFDEEWDQIVIRLFEG